MLVKKFGMEEKVTRETNRWVSCLALSHLADSSTFERFAHLVTRFPEFRTLVHYRLRFLPFPARLVCGKLWPRQPNLYLACEQIGDGLFIQHGFATGVDAERIGDDCWINQQVTIGNTPKGKPTIGNRVVVGAGAMVLGPVTIGDDAVVGANATVVTDVAPGSIVVGPKAVELRRGAADRVQD